MKPVLLLSETAFLRPRNGKTIGRAGNFFSLITSRFRVVALSILLLAALPSYADSFVSFTNSGYWDQLSTWKQNNKPASRLPNATDDVYISNGDIIKFRTSAQCASLTMMDGAGTAELIFLSPVTLTVQGDIVVNNPNNRTNVANSNALTIGTGILIARNLFIKADNAGNSPAAWVTVTTGSIYLSENLSSAGGAKAKFELGSQGYLEVGGDLGAGTIGDFTFDPNSTVNFVGATSQTMRTVYAYGHVKSNNAQGLKPDGPITANVIKGDLTIESGIFHNAGFPVQGAVSRTLLVKDNATLALTGTTGFPDGFSNLLLQDNSTVIYGGGAQVVAARSYGNLRLITEAPATASVKTLNGSAAIIKNLDFGTAKLMLGSNMLTLENNATITNASAAGYIVQGTGSKLLVKNLGQTGAGRGAEFTFPVGTATSFTPAYLTNFGATNTFSVNIADGVVNRNGHAITSRVVNKTWNINQETNSGAASLNMRLQWNPADEAPDFDRQNCGISHFENGEWHQPNSFSPAQGPAAGPFLATLGDIQSFSPFGVGDAMSALPVELKFFQAVKKDNKALLQWETASEENNLGFEIQVSADGRKFETITFVPSRNPNSNVSQRYEFLDRTGREGKWYFRLAQKDMDGTVAFYGVKVLEFGNLPESLAAYPNPFDQQCTLKIVATESGTTTILVTDITGKTVWSAVQKLEKGENRVQLTLGAELPAGMYLLTTGTGSQLNQLRLIKK